MAYFQMSAKGELRVKEEHVSMDAYSEKQSVKFIRDNFQCKECTLFSPEVSVSPKRGKSTVAYCRCGAAAEEHTNAETQPAGSEWSEENCIKAFPTNAFGRLRPSSTDFGSAQAIKYIRLSDNTDPALTLELLIKWWHLIETADGIEDPQLIISVVGGGRMFKLADNFQKKLFNRDLMRAVATTNGWLLTSGLHAGVSQAVGDALRESQSFVWRDELGKFKNKVCCIGIVPWGGAFGTNRLLNRSIERMNDMSYPVFAANTQFLFKKRLPLNPYHTHFLMVDDGHRNRERGVSEFRAKFEHQLSLPVESGGLGVPVVQILIEGAANALEIVACSVTEGIPVLVCEGTGRAADLLAEVCRLYGKISKTVNEEARKSKLAAFKVTLRQRIINNLYSDHLPEDADVRYDRCVRDVLTICEKRQLVTIFNVKRGSGLDTAILASLMDRTQHTERSAQLKLALKWNRIDVAKAKIFGAGTVTDTSFDLWPFFVEALLTNKPDFVRLFVEYGLDVKSSLTVEGLTNLYQASLEPHTLLWRLLKFDTLKVKESPMSLHDVYKMVKTFTRWFQHPLYCCEQQDENMEITFDEPFDELLLWAVINNNDTLAVLFWEYCEEPLVMAIIGTLLCQSLASCAQTLTGNLKELQLSLKKKLETLAINLADKAYAADVEQTMLLLHRRWDKWGNFTCMQLAASAKDQAFLSSEPCQYAIWKTWTRGFDATSWTIACSAFTVFPVLFAIQFEDEKIQHHSPRDLRGSIMSIANMVPGRQQRPHSLTLVPEIVDGALSSKEDPRQKRFFFSGSKDDLTFLTPFNVGIGAWKKYVTFYTSPSVKFACHTLSYIAYLILYAYVILFAFRFHPTRSEIVLHIWTFTLLCEQIRMVVSYPTDSFIHKYQEWWSYSSMAAWNRIDLLMLFLAVVAFILRWFTYSFNAARLILATNYITCLFRLFKIYFVNSYLGPKVVMLKRMAFDLAMFLLILIIILLSYTVVSHALLTPNLVYYNGIFWNLLYHGVWVLFGEVQPELDRATSPTCTAPGNNTAAAEECGLIRSFPPQILLAAYCFFGNILLVNMLIATFTNVFEEVQKNSEHLWKYLMYFVVQEFNDKPALPPPFIIIEHMYLLLNHCRKCKPFGGNASADLVWGRVLNEKNYRFLSVFERTIRSDLVEEGREGDYKQAEKLIPEMHDKLNRVLALIKELKEEAMAPLRGGRKQQGAFVPFAVSQFASRIRPRVLANISPFRGIGQIAPDPQSPDGEEMPLIDDEHDGVAGLDALFDEEEEEGEKKEGGGGWDILERFF